MNRRDFITLLGGVAAVSHYLVALPWSCTTMSK